MNLKDQIIAKLDGEYVEQIVIGERGTYVGRRLHSPQDWNSAVGEIDCDYRGYYCHPVYVWTPTRVLFVREQDCDFWIAAVPRNPAPTGVSYVT